MIVAFLGPDGSGKTFVINNLKKKLEKKKISLQIIHLKPDLIKNKKIKIVKFPHKKPKRSYLISICKLLYWLFIFRIFFIKNFFSKQKLFMFDRYPHDILIDPLRYRYNFNIYLTKIILSLFPQPDLWIHLKNKPEIIWKRKKEIAYEDLLHQLKDYKNFFKNKKNLIINNYKKDLKIIEINIIKLLNSLK